MFINPLKWISKFSLRCKTFVSVVPSRERLFLTMMQTYFIDPTHATSLGSGGFILDGGRSGKTDFKEVFEVEKVKLKVNFVEKFARLFG